MDDFEKRQREIERLSGEVDTLTRSRDKNEQRMAVTKAKWLPALTELITRVSASFSAAFQRLGCAGEVQLAQHDDYDKWGIEILVKFRDTEDLQRLTGSRQSGGERSLTTIFYLMSLIELSRSPFSLVDEINQGMDPRAERNAHNELVQTTCSPNASQYFLITPKLLSDLKFHPRMKTLIVMNGDWLPKQFDCKSVTAFALPHLLTDRVRFIHSCSQRIREPSQEQVTHSRGHVQYHSSSCLTRSFNRAPFLLPCPVLYLYNTLNYHAYRCTSIRSIAVLIPYTACCYTETSGGSLPFALI